jgi:flagellar FliJ protein
MEARVLSLLIEKSRRERDSAASESAVARTQQMAAQKTLDVLRDYLMETNGRAPQIKGIPSAVSATGFMIHERFARNIERAIDEQQQKLALTQQTCDEKDAVLAARQRRLMAFETLETRRLEAIRTSAARHEQRINDEIAARIRPLVPAQPSSPPDDTPTD